MGVGNFGVPAETSSGARPGTGHAHFWERALSRRAFIGSAGAGGAILGTAVVGPIGAVAKHSGPATPRPIPGGFQPPGGPLFHVFGPSPDNPDLEPSSITDFNGVVGFADVRGDGTAWNTHTGESKTLLYDTDMRFMKGKFVGTDRKLHEGAFGFV